MSELLGKNELGALGSGDRLSDASTSIVQKPDNNTAPQTSGASATVPDQVAVKSPAAIPETIFSASLGASVHDSPKNLVNIFMKFVETSLPLPRKADLMAAALTFAKTLGITKEEASPEESGKISQAKKQERKIEPSRDDISSQGNFEPTVSVQQDNRPPEKSQAQAVDDMDFNTPPDVAGEEEVASSLGKTSKRRKTEMAAGSYRSPSVHPLFPLTESGMDGQRSGFGGNQNQQNPKQESEKQNA